MDYRTAVLVLDSSQPQALSERDLYQLDQFIMRGGSLVVLAKPMNVDWHTLSKATPVDWGRLEKCLEKWGLSVAPRLVLALSSRMQPWRIPSQSARTYIIGPYPYFLQCDS